jgi:catechol 2,3-dioxygenase-like lactoylglutathione lyase family enzyme
MHVDSIDHFVLTVASIEQACEFYERVLGMKAVSFGEGRNAARRP